VIPNKVSVRVPGIILLPGLFLFLGCTTSSPPSPTISSKSESSHFLASGKVLFRQPDQKQSGDLELRYSDPGRFKLKIFTPLVGSLIYELRADKQQLMVLDYHNEWFVLKANDADARREWLGMDLSLEELGWLLQGIRERPPKGWSLISNRSESMRISQAEKEISISFDPQGRILTLEKFNEGLAEYEVTISRYLEADPFSAPRMLQITDFSGNYQLRLVLSQVRRPSSFAEPISFENPEELEAYEMMLESSGS